jgi:hypothetical protein
MSIASLRQRRFLFVDPECNEGLKCGRAATRCIAAISINGPEIPHQPAVKSVQQF